MAVQSCGAAGIQNLLLLRWPGRRHQLKTHPDLATKADGDKRESSAFKKLEELPLALYPSHDAAYCEQRLAKGVAKLFLRHTLL